MQLAKFKFFCLLIFYSSISCGQNIGCKYIDSKCFLSEKLSDGIIGIINQQTQNYLDSRKLDVQEINTIDFDNNKLGLAISSSFSKETIDRIVQDKQYLVVKYYFSSEAKCLGIEFLYKEESNFELKNLSAFEDQLMEMKLINIEYSPIPKVKNTIYSTGLVVHFKGL